MTPLTPLRAIRAKCMDCVCGQSLEVKLCPCDGTQSTYCPLYPYRLGRGPKREMTEAQRQASANNFKRALLAQKSP